jgi:hemoglobin
MDMNPIKYLVVFLALIGLSLSSQANDDDLYQDLGGKAGIEAIVDGFVTEISFDQEIYPFFKDSDIGRLREKLVEQFCMLSHGPCEYSGDSMKDVHAGMHITSGQFNRTVELLQASMDKNDIPFAVQNRLIKLLAPMRPDIYHR